MKCPKCGDPRLKYTEKASARTREDRLAGKTGTSRTDLTAHCKKCGWSGEAR
jgi:hypothetical protein